MSREEQLRQLALEELAKEELDEEEKNNKLGTKDNGKLMPVDENIAPGQLPAGLSPRDRVVIGQDEMEKASAFGLGMVEGVPFAKDLLSAGEAVIKSSPDHYGEAYTSNRKDWDEAINDAEAKNPAAFMMGDVASGVAIPLPIKGIKGAMAMGALSMASREEDRDPFQMAKAATLGAGLGGTMSAAMMGAGKVIDYVGSKLGLLAARTTGEAVGALSGKYKQKLNNHIYKTGTEGVSEATKTIEFAQRIAKANVDGEPLLGTSVFKGQSFYRTAEKALKARQNAGNKIGEVVNVLDELVPDEISGKVLHDKVMTKMGIPQMVMSDDPLTVELAAKYKTLIKSQFIDISEEVVPQVVKRPMIGANGSPVMDSKGSPIMIDEVIDTVKKTEVFKKLTPKQIHAMKIDHSQSSNKVSSGFAKLSDADKQKALGIEEMFDTNLNSTLNEVMEEVAGKASKENPQLLNAYKQANLHYSDMDMVYKISNDQAKKQGGGAMEIIKRGLAVRGLLVAQLQASTGTNAVLAAGMGAAINEAINDPKTGSKMATSLNKVSSFIQDNPDSPFLKRIVLAAQVSAYDDNDPENDYLRKTLSSVGSELLLRTSPIKRNLNDIKAKSDLILEAVEYHDPAMADQFRQAIKNKDDETIRQMMNEASKNPELKDLFEDGRGIDGRVFSEEEKQSLHEELDSMDVSLIQRLKLKRQLDDGGVIPVVEEEQERFFKYKKRDKSQPSY